MIDLLMAALLGALVAGGIYELCVIRPLQRKLQISRDANDAYKVLLDMVETQAKSDVNRWKCVALGQEWKP